jgi:autotransporter adhesin
LPEYFGGFEVLQATATITAAQVNNGSSTDACGIATLSCYAFFIYRVPNTGANTVTLTVTDVNGNSSTCTATVTINDVTPPTAICTNITAQLNAAGTVTIAAGDVDNGSTDACGNSYHHLFHQIPLTVRRLGQIQLHLLLLI